MPGRPLILQATPLPDHAEAGLREQFEVLVAPMPSEERLEFARRYGAGVRGIATTGKGPVNAALLALLPDLEIIASFSAGLDGIDLTAAAARGIVVTNTSEVLADDVADVALWLTIGLARRLPEADNWLRAGNWAQGAFPLARSMRGMRVGILGLGRIGGALAARLELLGAELAYHGRRSQPDRPWRFEPDLEVLAGWAEVLVVACPGGAATRHLVSARILDRLGPQGFLVNISRGSVVDQDALIVSLAAGNLAGAGLDVFAAEPSVPRAMLESPRTILLPHLASGTLSTRVGMGRAMIAELIGHLC